MRERKDLIRTPNVPRLVFPPSRWTERGGAAAADGAGPEGPFADGAEDVTGTGAAMMEKKKENGGM